MFRKNDAHLQRSFFAVDELLSKSQMKEFQKSREWWYYELVFKLADGPMSS